MTSYSIQHGIRKEDNHMADETNEVPGAGPAPVEEAVTEVSDTPVDPEAPAAAGDSSL